MPNGIRDLCVLRCLNNCIPVNSTESDRALVQEGWFENYRPIAWAGISTRLHTCQLTDCVVDYAEYHEILAF